ncbi:MAG TPA: Lrp/AsnC family transcriptional regulator [Nitrososphaerales archaeon]|nr:Lrp/AsnC family transcriptional regulator [Nitrososphaerales archaeon]
MAETSSRNHIRSSKISRVDKEILKVLLEPDGKVPTHALAQKLRVPLTTVQRRRAHLERKYLDVSYTLRLENLGIRRVDFFLYTAGGNTSEIGRDLLKRREIVSVGRSVGEHTIDLRAEAIIKDSGQLLDLLEAIKGMPNVKDVIWSEIVDVVGRKQSIPSDIIDTL